MANKLGITLLALVAVLLLPQSASADVKVRYFKGAPTFISTLPNSAVEVGLPPPTNDHRIWIAVAVLNRGASPLTLGYENIAITSASGVPAKLHAYDDLQHSARVKAGWMTFFAALAGGLNSYAATQSAYGHASGGAYSATPYGGVSTTFSSTYYSPVAAQMALDRADAENTSMFHAIAGQLDAALAKDDAVLRTTTIDPADSFGGAVVFDLPRGAQMKDMVVTVDFGGETHRISLDPSAPDITAASSAEIEAGRPAQPVANPSPTAAEVAPPRPVTVATAPPPPVTGSANQPRKRCLLWSPTNPSSVTCGE